MRRRIEARSNGGRRRCSSPVATVVESRNDLVIKIDGRVGSLGQDAADGSWPNQAGTDPDMEAAQGAAIQKRTGHPVALSKAKTAHGCSGETTERE